MTSGARPLPTALKVVRGTASKAEMAGETGEPQVDGVARMPSNLSKQAKAIWKQIAPTLRAAGILTSVDGAALSLYCESAARYRHAMKQLDKLDLVTVSTATGYASQSQWLAIANKAWDQQVKLLIEFGMTPSSRSKVDTKATIREEAKKTGLASFRK